MSSIIKSDPDSLLSGSVPIKTRSVGNKKTDELNEQLHKESQHILIHAEDEAAEMIKMAQLKAQAIIEEAQIEKESWKQEKETLAKQAWEEGFAQGAEEGRKSGREEYDDLISLAAKIVAQAKEEANRHVEKSEETILQLAISCTESILGTTLSEKPETFIHVVKKALSEFKNEYEVEILIHPSRYPLLVGSQKTLESIFHQGVQCYISPDEDISEDECIVDTPAGRISAGIDSQLSELRASLVELLATEGKE